MQDSQLDDDGQLPGERSAVGSEADTYQREVCKHTIEAYFFVLIHPMLIIFFLILRKNKLRKITNTNYHRKKNNCMSLRSMV